jgi:hypothetical protein
MKVKIKSVFLLMTLLFVGLKCFGAITWSWWWVLSPLLLPCVLLLIVGVVIALFVYLID